MCILLYFLPCILLHLLLYVPDQIGQRNYLHCIVISDCYTRLVRYTTCPVLYHTCVLFHVRVVRDTT